MLTQSTLNCRSLLSRGRLLAVLATAGLALTGAAPAGATINVSFTSVQWTYTKQKDDGGPVNVPAHPTTTAGKTS